MMAATLIFALHESALALPCGQLMLGKTILLFLAGASLVRADLAADKLTSSGIAEFAAAYQAWDGARFGKAADYFRQAEAFTPTSAVNPAWRGAALFHQMLQLKSASDPKGASTAMDAALASLATAVKLDTGNAESHALLGTLYGMKINGSTLRAIRYGPTVQKHQELALKHGAQNPRVRYLLGAGQFHTARNDAARREALNTLLAAEKWFKAEAGKPAKPFEPRWGHGNCLTLIARSHEALGQKPEAVTYYQKALAVHPADHAAKAGLDRLKTMQPDQS
jgi:tetratricopeptide (TPR) repeat protein